MPTAATLPRSGPGPRRYLVVALVVVVVLILTLSALRHVPEPAGEGAFFVLASSTGGAETLEPGWTLVPPLFWRVLEFPTAPVEVRVRAGSPVGVPLLTREGVGVFASGSVRARALAERPDELARAFPDGWSLPSAEALLRDGLESSLQEHARSRSITELLMASPEGESMADAIAAILEPAGLALDGPPAVAYYPASRSAAAASGERTRDGRRVLLIGLDGADWDIIDPLMAAGRMPNLKRLVASGVRARLRTISPALSPLIWTTMATGVGPEKHGILDFVAVSPETGATIPVTSNLRRVKALWNILTGAGRTSGVIAWWASWPAEPVDGFIVSDRVAYQLFGGETKSGDLGRLTHPESLWLAIRGLVTSPEDVSESEVARFIDPASEAPEREDHVRRLRRILASTKTYMAIGTTLLRAYDPDFKALYLEGTDTIAHDFMRYRPPAMNGVSPELVAAYGEVVDRYYEYTDELLGEILTLADPATVVMVCSDHGFRTGRNRPATDPRIDAGGAADWHRRFGILVMSGPGVRQDEAIEAASVMDITPTILSVMGLPVAADMDGGVVREAFVMPSPPRGIASYEDGAAPGEASPIPSVADEEMLARLKALGYVAQEGSNAMNNAGITLLDQGRHAEAAKAFEEAVASQPGFLAAMINLGRARMLLKDYDGALKVLEQVLAADDARAEVYNLIGNVHMSRGDLDLAEKALNEGLRFSPDDVDLRNTFGLLEDQRGRPEEALRQYRRAIEVDPDYAEAYNNIGLVFRRNGQPLEAIAMFEKAIETDPEFPGSYNNLGVTYQDLGRFEEAEAALMRGLAVAPENAVMANSLGTIELDLGRKDRAEQLFAQAVRLDPSYAEPHNNLGAIAGMRGDIEGAWQGYSRAVTLNPDYIDARYNLAMVHIERSETGKAIEHLEAILRIDPDHTGAMLQIGFLLTQSGDLEGALQRAARAAALEPGNPQCHNLLADIYVRSDRMEDAREALMRSLALKPDQPAVVKALERLGGRPAGS